MPGRCSREMPGAPLIRNITIRTIDGCHSRGGHRFAALAVLFSLLVPVPVLAQNAAFHLSGGHDSCDGTGQWQGSHFSGSCKTDRWNAQVTGDLSAGGFDVTASIGGGWAGGGLLGPVLAPARCPFRGSIFPATGHVEMLLNQLCGHGMESLKLRIDIPATSSGLQ